MRWKTFYLIVLLFCSAAQSCAQVSISEKEPQRIILNVTENPATSIAVTWCTREKVTDPEIRYAVATDWKGFEDNLEIVEAEREEYFTEENKSIFSYSGIIKNLMLNEKYVYSVGGESNWSEWNQFETGKEETEPFQFIYFGDPQNDNRMYVSRVFREAFKTAPSADFWLFAGDIVNAPTDDLIQDFFYAGSFMFRSIPIMLVPGNHDVAHLKQNWKSKGNNGLQNYDKVSELWRASFTLPENGLPGFEEASYHFDYHGVRFIMIDSNDEDRLEEQAAWMENLLRDNPNRWTIVSFHHPIFSVADDRDDDETREAFMHVFDKHNVDLVLTGHDHAYARSYKLKEGKPVGNDRQGTVYVVSVCGPKMYDVVKVRDDKMAKTGQYTQMFQVISVSKNKISFEARTVTGKLFDSFELIKGNF